MLKIKMRSLLENENFPNLVDFCCRFVGNFLSEYMQLEAQLIIQFDYHLTIRQKDQMLRGSVKVKTCFVLLVFSSHATWQLATDQVLFPIFYWMADQ